MDILIWDIRAYTTLYKPKHSYLLLALAIQTMQTLQSNEEVLAIQTREIKEGVDKTEPTEVDNTS